MNKYHKKILIAKPFLPPKNEYLRYLDTIWNNTCLTNNGPLHNEFEEKLECFLKVDNVCLFANGHLALDVAIKSLNLKGRVITTPFTFASTIHAITMNQLIPDFCDIELDTFNIDTDKIEQFITNETSAIIPVHVFGNPCQTEKIKKLADKYNLKVIYDAAHAFGVEINGNGIGSYGDISMFSLHATKVFHSIEGGVLSFRDNQQKTKLNLLKNFGIADEERVLSVGLNAKMSEFHAAMGLTNLDHIEEQINKRKRLVHVYRNLLSCVSGIRFLQDIDNIKHNYSYFPILINKDQFGVNRDTLYEKLKEHNIFTRKYFYPLCPDFDCYKFDSSSLVNARYISMNVLTLPIYGSLEIEDIRYICKIIKMIKG